MLLTTSYKYIHMETKTVKLNDICIPQAFAKTTPKQEKVQKFMDEYRNNGDFQKHILLAAQNLLVDGYARFVALTELGEEECVVDLLCEDKKYSICPEPPRKKEIETMYIFGVHPTSHTNKEYMWRVPNKPSFVFFKGKIQPGDMILVHTKYGVMPVTVTRTERRPIQDETVKTVAKNKILRGGVKIGN